MNRLLLVVILYSISQVVYAEYKSSVGFGLQYGGVGYQGSYLGESSKLYASIGLLSASLGAQRILGEEYYHAVGINLGWTAFSEEFIGLAYNYFKYGAHRRGPTLGIEIGRLRFKDDNLLFSTHMIQNIALVSEQDAADAFYLSLNFGVQF